MLPFRSKYVSRLAPLAVLGALALVPAAASATVTSTTVTSPAAKSNIMQLNNSPLPFPTLLADKRHASGTAPGASDGDQIRLICDRDGGSISLPVLVPVNNEKWTTTNTPAYVDGIDLAIGALSNAPGASGMGQMCNIRAVPVDYSGSDPRPFPAQPIGIGRLDTFTDGLGVGTLSPAPHKNYEAASNQSGGAFQITSAGDSGVKDGRRFYGSNFAKRSGGVFSGVASFGENPVPGLGGLLGAVSNGNTMNQDSSIGISNVDGSDPGKGLLPFDQNGLPLGGNGNSAITTVQRSVDGNGNATVREVSQARECHIIAVVQCAGYDDAGLKLERVTTTSADGVTATITDTWTNTSGIAQRYDLRYHNKVGNGANTGIAAGGGTPQTKAAFDTFLPNTSGPWSMLINSNLNDPNTNDHGAITYMNAPDMVTMEGADRFQSWYQRTLAPGTSTQVKQVLNQSSSVPEAQAAAAAAQSGGAAPAAAAPATLSASGARQQQAIAKAAAKQSAGQGRARYTASARIAKGKNGKRYIRLQVSGAPGSVKIKLSMLNKNGKKVGKAAKITVATNKKLNIRSLSVPKSARKVLVSAL